MRRTFADILNDAEVDVAAEYHSLYMLVYEREGFYADMEDYFEFMSFSGTAYNLRDFNDRNGFHFDRFDYSDNLDDLLLFSEYVYNFAVAIALANGFDHDYCGQSVDIVDHLLTLANKIHYQFIKNEKLWVLVPSNEKIEAAAEVAPEAAGNDLFRYDYRGYEGDLGSKRKMLVGLAAALEPYRAKMGGVAKAFTSDYFFLVNSLNIRHNNVDPIDPSKYREAVAKMSDGELEAWYDTVHYMSAAAFLLLDYDERSEAIKDLKRG